jgi:hypothetical protein
VGSPGVSETPTIGVKKMNYPKVRSAKAIDDHTLLVEFNNRQKKKYDVSPLLQKEMFLPLKNPAFFKAVKVEPGGYAVVWNSNIDISEYELWSNGQEMHGDR